MNGLSSDKLRLLLHPYDVPLDQRSENGDVVYEDNIDFTEQSAALKMPKEEQFDFRWTFLWTSFIRSPS